MKLDEAMPLLERACGKRFGELFVGHPEDLRTNKGHAGQLLLTYIGLKLDCNLCDFDDGELKTNKALPNGEPLETMWITQILGDIDNLVGASPTPFRNSRLYTKIRNLVYLPVVKQSSNPADWYFVKCIRVRADEGSELYEKYQQDYEFICSKLTSDIEHGSDSFIHTSSGPNYIQVRSKDSKPYKPIFSKKYGRLVSNKNHGFYFMKSFMRDALAGRF